MQWKPNKFHTIVVGLIFVMRSWAHSIKTWNQLDNHPYLNSKTICINSHNVYRCSAYGWGKWSDIKFYGNELSCLFPCYDAAGAACDTSCLYCDPILSSSNKKRDSFAFYFLLPSSTAARWGVIDVCGKANNELWMALDKKRAFGSHGGATHGALINFPSIFHARKIQFAWFTFSISTFDLVLTFNLIFSLCFFFAGYWMHRQWPKSDYGII